MQAKQRLISIRISGLYGPQPSSDGSFACKTGTLVPELQVSMGPRPHLWFFAFKTATLSPELHSVLGVPPLICGFVHAKQRDFWIRITSLNGSRDLTCRFVHAKQRDYH